jgi:hypothetical protein
MVCCSLFPTKPDKDFPAAVYAVTCRGTVLKLRICHLFWNKDTVAFSGFDQRKCRHFVVKRSNEEKNEYTARISLNHQCGAAEDGHGRGPENFVKCGFCEVEHREEFPHATVPGGRGLDAWQEEYVQKQLLNKSTRFLSY